MRLNYCIQLGMVLNESLRLYTPASLLPRQGFENVKVGDVELPKGISVWIPVLAIHHSKELWGEGAKEFNPQRFAEGVQASDGIFTIFLWTPSLRGTELRYNGSEGGGGYDPFSL